MSVVQPDPRLFSTLPIKPPPRNQALTPGTFTLPPSDGSLFVHELFDWHYEHSPDHPVFQYANDDGSITTLTMSRVAPAIHRAGRFVQSVITAEGVDASKKIVVGILAASESITSATLLMGVLRAGFVLFPISVRNSPAAVAHLLGATAVDVLLVGPEHTYQHLAHEAFAVLREQGRGVPQMGGMPEFSDLYVDADEKGWERLPQFHPDPNELATYMHSSGSTAFPKPIPWTYARETHISIAPFFGERDWTGTRLGMHAVPMYHGMGVIPVIWAASLGVVLQVFPPQSPARTATPDNLLKAIADTKSHLVFAVPNFVEVWAKNPDQVRVLQNTEGVLFGGGPLSKEAGDFLWSQGVNVYSLYACTEAGVLNPTLPKTGSKDWEYFTFPANVYSHLVPDADGICELVVKTGEYAMVSVVNCEVDGVPAYNTHDLLAPHPTKPGYWKVFGRSDDQIMHSTGEKTNPGPLEAILNQDPHVRSAVMFGRGRFNAGILVDPTDQHKFDPADTYKLTVFRNAIWPTIEKMNAYAPQHSRVFKEMIIVASPSKPFAYTAKNTARRQAMIDAYADEIDRLYDTVDEGVQVDLSPPPVWTLDTARDFVQAAVGRVMERTVGDNDDLFQNGCDSLQATWIRNALLHALRDSTDLDTRAIPKNFVYQHPTIAGLAAFVFALASPHSRGTDAGAGETKTAVSGMLRMVAKYSADFPVHAPVSSDLCEELGGEVVLVTGTTGGLGASLLASLVRAPEVARVYAVNRAGSVPILQRQKDVLDERGFDGAAIVGSSKIVLIEARTEEERLGLCEHVYDEIRKAVTLIIHNAWPVNFNMSLGSFEPSIKGVRDLIDLALSSPHTTPPKLLFISSIGVLRHMDHSKPALEEAVDPAVAVGTGYSESKWVSEKLLAIASDQTPLHTAVIRLGQITGTSAGAWKSAEWLPSLVKSSVYLGCLPTLDKTIAWIPVDIAARAVFEMRTSLTSSSLRFFHLAHPRPVRWTTVMAPLAHSLGLRTVSYDDWLALLVASGESLGAANEVDIMQRNPALKIVEFFKAASAGTTESPEAMGIPALDVVQAVNAAPSLGAESLPQLGAEDAGKWLEYWKGVGFL